MSRTRSRALAFACGLVAAGALVLGGCDGDVGPAAPADQAVSPAAEPHRSWERFDLWATPPANAARRPVRPVEVPLGPTGTRDLANRPGNAAPGPVPDASAGLVRALEQHAGTVARWRLTLGEEPFLSFVPLRDRDLPCDCTLRVSVADGGEPRQLAELTAGDTWPAAPATAEVDLAAWSGRSVELTLAVVPTPGAGRQPRARALWGSPTIHMRRPAARPDAPTATPTRPNVLLLGFDTLRADALGAWGREPSVTPALDRLAAESDVFLDTISCFNVTTPSFISLMTGLYGKHHGSYGLRAPLPAERTTLAEVLATAGWDTFATISARHLGDPNSGLGQGFATFAVSADQDAAELAVDRTLGWLEQPRERPFFAWVHLFDPHTPHTPPRPYAEGRRPAHVAGMGRVDAWSAFRDAGLPGWREPRLGGHHALYAGEVAYLDRHVGRLLDWLESRGALDDTLVVAIADHGENMEEHGVRYRHAGLWEATTRVPLIVRRPGARREGRRLEGLVQNVDVFPTILAAVGLEPPPQDGQELDRIVARGGRDAAFAEHADATGAMIRTATWRLSRSRGNPLVPDGTYLFDLLNDPAETTNLAGRGLAEERRLSELLDAWLAHRPRAGTVGVEPPLDPESRRRLEALGYL